jgi:small multidrug resistance family-3 protein
MASMSFVATFFSLLAAAVLEAGGDASIRIGLHGSSGSRRLALLAAGSLILFGYGCLVNIGRWEFGRLLGVYIVVFFVVAQTLGWLVFGQAPTRSIWWGGLFVVIGGLIVAAN